jgi:hypothetical protein
MAYTAGNLVLMSNGNGFNHYRYDTTDTAATVDGDGYFNNSDDDLNLAVGDEITVIVWNTAVRTGTISDYAKHIVMVVDSDGTVDLSDDLHNSAAVTSGD